MIHFELGIRYLSQLRRTRSNDMGRLESTIVAALRDSGARVRREGDALYAVFDEGAIGFWLDLAIALESVAAALTLVERDLLGRACFIGALEPPAEEREARLRSLCSRPNRTGLWCDAIVADALDAYARFRPDGELHVLESFVFRDAVPHSRSGYLIRPQIAEAVRRAGLDPSAPPVAIVGPGLVGKRQTLDSVLASYGGSVLALRVRFDERSGSIAAIADALASLTAGQSEIVASASANRFSLDPTPALLDSFSRCFAAALKSQIDAAGAGATPVLVLEEIDKADAHARECLRRCFAVPGILGGLALFATATDASVLPVLVGTECRTIPAAYPDCSESASLLPESAESAAIPAEETSSGGLPAAYRAALGWSQRPDGRPRSIHARLPADLLEIAYALALAHGAFPLGELVSVLFPDGKPRVSLPLALARLADLGVLAAADDPRPVVPDFLSFSESVLGRRVDTVRALVRDRVLAAVSKGRLRKSFETLERLSALGGTGDDDLVLESLVNGALRGERRAVQRAIDCGCFADIVGKTRAASLERIFRSRSALVFGTEAEIRAAFSSPVPEAFPAERYRAYDSMDAASVYFACARIDQTLPLAASAVKEALLILQSLPPSGALARAYRLLGEIELSRERIAEAMDYFSFAAESADRCGDVYESLLADVNGAATQFLFGNYSKAERCAQAAIKKARSSYQVDWERWSRFMVGRVLFETGRYAAALETFAEVVGAFDAESGPKKALAEAWKIRAAAFASESYTVVSALPSESAEAGDSALFAVEAAYLAGDFENAVRLSDAFLALPVEPRFRSPERVDWSSGFAMVEDRSVGNASGDSVVRRLVRAYRALSLASGPDPREAVAELHRLSKEERVSDFDPYDAFYFRALSIANAAADLPSIDRQTILSIAFKRLQRRASRIDDADVRRSYQFSNRWNATLYADAQANKLI